MEWNGTRCLDSRPLCLAVEQFGYPNCSRVQGNRYLTNPSPQGHRKESAIHPFKFYRIQTCIHQTFRYSRNWFLIIFMTATWVTSPIASLEKYSKRIQTFDDLIVVSEPCNLGKVLQENTKMWCPHYNLCTITYSNLGEVLQANTKMWCPHCNLWTITYCNLGEVLQANT